MSEAPERGHKDEVGMIEIEEAGVMRSPGDYLGYLRVEPPRTGLSCSFLS